MRTVTSLTVSPKGGKIKVCLSDGEYFVINKGTDFVATLAEGSEVDDETLAFLQSHRGVTASEAAGMLLGRKAYSERELFDKLTGKGYSPKESAEAVMKMREYGLVDDRQYAKDLVELCLAKQRSRRAISETLRQHGIDKELISEMLEELPDQRLMVKEIVQRRYGDIEGMSREEQNRVINFLRGRGFDWRDIASVVKNYEEY